MDKEKLIELLQASQIPDTDKVKAVTAELNKYYSRPESLLLLIEVAITHADAGIRQLATVQALRYVDKHWSTVAANQKQIARTKLLEFALAEKVVSTRHSLARLVARIGTLDMQNKEGADQVKTIIQLNMASDVASKEVGSYVVYALLENDPTEFTEHLPQLFELLARTIVDPDSPEVRVNAVKAIGALLLIVEPEEDETSVNALHKLFPHIITVLQHAITNGHMDQYRDIFEVLQSFLAYDSVLLGKHLQDLIHFMIDLAVNKSLEEEARTQALAFLSQCVHTRRMKIQAMRDMGAQLMRKSVAIVSEIDGDSDDEDEISPGRTALALIDQLASDLPPRQVINPLLEDFQTMARHPDPGQRKAAILSLGTAAEGAPDFLATQVAPLLPLIVDLLNDSDSKVRYAAIIGLIHLADEFAGDLSPQHGPLMEALVNNLTVASQSPDKNSISIVRAVCGALESLGAELEGDVSKAYAPKLIQPLSALLSHSDHAVKSAAAGAIGSIALAMGSDFLPYFKETMAALGAYATLEGDEDALSLRSAVCDAMGRIATAVGGQEFRPYVLELMQASEAGLEMENERLKETSFILWSSLAKVYGEEFGEFLPGVFKGLLATLELEEEEISLEGLAETGEDQVLVVGGKKLRIKKASQDDEEDEAAMDDDADWDDIDDFTGATAVALEQEIALEVLGDVISLSCNLEAIKTYLEPTLEKVMLLTEHSFDGCRKAALSTLWRSYARVWQLHEEHTGTKWTAGAPGPMPEPVLGEIAKKVCTATLRIWADESERTVVTDINRNAAVTLKACGPALLGVEDMETQMITVIASIITRSHPCQQDLGDDDESQEAEEGSAEYDWLVIDTALDVVLGMAEALGPRFAKHWNTLQRPIIKFCSSQDALERSTAMGVIAEVIKYMGAEVTPFTDAILKIVLHRLTDTDSLARSNTAYAAGQLIANSTDPAVLRAYPDVATKLEPALSMTESRMRDNVAGCFARMITKQPTPEVAEKLLPPIVEALPLKEDYEENIPVFQCIYKLYELSNPTVQEQTPQLISVFEAVLGDPQEQLDQPTRELVRKIVHLLYQHKEELFHANPGALKLAGAI